MQPADRRRLESPGGGTLSRQLDLLRGARDAALALLGLTPPAPPARRTRRRARRSHADEDLVPTSVLARDRRCDLVLRKVRYVRGFFPELEGMSLRVGLTRRAAGLAELEGRTLWLNPHRLALHTIAHELTHLLQGRGHVPGGERSCDVFAMARHASLVDVMPCYLELPASMADGDHWLRPGAGRLLHELAREAVERRAAGLRRYIRWLEDEARACWESEHGGPAAPRPDARQHRLL